VLHFKKSQLKNGIRVVSELHPHSRSVALGIWVLTGTRDEKPEDAGISHFLEHMVFKGTRSRSAFQIAKSLESLGGELNAYTTREYTCYHALVLQEHWEKGLEILSDLVSNMSFTRDDFAVEKSVILQEIAMGEDNLEELVYDIYLDESLRKNPLGRSILGTAESISKMTQKQMIDYYRHTYSGDNIIVSAAGCLDHQSLLEGVEKYLGNKAKRRFKRKRQRPKHTAFRRVEKRESEQLHLLMGFPCTSFKDNHRFEAFVVNALLGGGMTSRLYQRVREKKGLVYSIYSSLNTFEDYGMVNVYAACEPEKMLAVIRNVVAELKKVRRLRLTEGELQLFKTQVTGSILLGSEDIENRMTSLGVNEMVFGKYRPVEEVVEEINKITVKSVREFINNYLNLSESGWLLVGSQADEFESYLKSIEF
jgi:predicted Zn-dependent peptidase